MPRTQPTAHAPTYSQFKVIEHRMGYKPVIGCTGCGDMLDTNRTTARENEAWRLLHEQCVPDIAEFTISKQLS